MTATHSLRPEATDAAVQEAPMGRVGRSFARVGSLCQGLRQTDDADSGVGIPLDIRVDSAGEVAAEDLHREPHS